MLGAWSLKLAAWGLRLVVRGSRSLALEAWCLGLSSSFIFLVFWVCDIAHAPVPACSAVTAAVALIHGRAGLALR